MSIDPAYVEILGIPPIRQRTANGWGTEDLLEIISRPVAKNAKG
jgi:hypothetical protein